MLSISRGLFQIRIPTKGDTPVYNRYSCVAKNSIGFDNFTAQLAEAREYIKWSHLVTNSLRAATYKYKHVLGL